MRYYQELTILPDAEIPLYFILSEVYQQLHLGFVEKQDENGIVSVGVSFPLYQFERRKGKIGEKIRFFANKEHELNELAIKKWLQKLNDYVHITGIRQVPEKVAGYAIYRRVHTENNAKQKACRFIKRHKEENFEYEQVMKMFSEKERICYLPYVKQRSLTNHNTFRLYIEKICCENEMYEGFGTYGLSNINSASTVPEF